MVGLLIGLSLCSFFCLFASSLALSCTHDPVEIKLHFVFTIEVITDKQCETATQLLDNEVSSLQELV